MGWCQLTVGKIWGPATPIGLLLSGPSVGKLQHRGLGKFLLERGVTGSV